MRGGGRMGKVVIMPGGLGSAIEGAGASCVGSPTNLYKSMTVCSRSARSTGNRQSLNRFAYVL